MFTRGAAAYCHFVATPSHVMLLNASPDESDMYEFWLKSCGYRVTVAEDLGCARDIARQDAVDILVIDAWFGASFRDEEFEEQWTEVTHAEPLGIVVLSGYLTDAGRPPQRGGRTVCVFKPCLPQQLSRSIADLLSTTPPASLAADKGNSVVTCSPS